MPKFDAEDALAAIERYRVTTSQWVPTMFTRMLQLPDEVRARYDLSSLIHAVHAAAPCPIPVKKKMIEWWGPILHEYYSGTEGAGFTYVNSPDWLAHPSTVGRPLVGSVHICDDDGNELPVGEAGAVFFNSGAKFEYHGDAAKTKESRHPKGWTSFGDVGRVDRDGFLHLKDRKAFLIISGGVNIYPQEAENVLAVHPKVYDVAVFGVPNPEFGEEVKAVVQPIDWPATDGQRDALAAELIAWCREHLASLKCPRSVDFRRELPRHPTGKLLKRQLRDEYWGGRGDIIVHRTAT
jgi:acyl-CoA synthetase (AMP-forming)/AMP-acid ligase II